MIPDPYKKTVQIPVRLVEGKLRFFYGGPIPSISDGAIGELVVPEYAVKNEYKLNLIRRCSKKTVSEERDNTTIQIESKNQG